MSRITLFVPPLLAALALGCTNKEPGVNVDTGGLGTDGTDGTGADGTEETDADGDGFPADEDCDDSNADVNPEADEVCDGVDNDCDDLTDEDDSDLDEGTLETFWIDGDGDGWGDPTSQTQACVVPPDGVGNGQDCDDADANRFPGNPEVCDGLDNDCDDATLETEIDLDGDGFFDLDCGGDDCNDDDVAINPGEAEVCDDGIDNDCDGSAGVCAPSGDYSLSNADVILRGENPGDRAGQGDPGFTIAGDHNGDGTLDLMISAIFHEGGATDSGAVYIVNGPLTPGETSLSTASARVEGANETDLLGRSINSVGDTNGDGFDDILLNAVFADDGGSNSGTTYLMQGPFSGTLSVDDAHATIIAAGDDAQVADIDALGDIRGRIDGLLLGAQRVSENGTSAGAVYLLPTTVSGEVDLATDGVRIDGAAGGDELGSAVGSGDFTGDGVPDAILGALKADDGGEDAGSVYLFAGPITANTTASSADAIYAGARAGDQLGSFASVADARDLDGDGIKDMVFGTRNNDIAAANAGQVYVVLGSSSPTSASAADSWMVLNGTLVGDRIGESVDGLGDFDGDGTNDLFVGSAYAGTTGGGMGYLLLGPHTGGSFDITAASAATFTAEAADDLLRVQAGEDLNNDGKADLLLAAQRNDSAGTDAGAGFVFYGFGL